MQERSRTFCLFLESLLKFRPTFYDQFTFETAIAIVNIPNYKYHHCYYPRSKLYIVSTYVCSYNINTEYIFPNFQKSKSTGIYLRASKINFQKQMFSEYVYRWDQIDLCMQLLPYQVSPKLVYKQISSLLTYLVPTNTATYLFPQWPTNIFCLFSFFLLSTVGRANFGHYIYYQTVSS